MFWLAEPHHPRASTEADHSVHVSGSVRPVIGTTLPLLPVVRVKLAPVVV